MKTFFFLITLTAIIATISSGIQHVAALRLAPTFTLDLRKSPSKRWDGVVDVIFQRHSFEESFGPVFADFNRTVFQKLSADQRTRLEAVVKTRYPENFEEITGIAGQFAAKGHDTVDALFLSNYLWLHELEHARESQEERRCQREWKKAHPTRSSSSSLISKNRECTGILVLPADRTSSITHGRNLDQGDSSGRNMTLTMTIITNSISPSGGKYDTFFASDFYWPTTGFVTAASFTGGITLQENWRFCNLLNGSDACPSLDQLVGYIERPATVPQVLMFREFLVQQASYNSDPAGMFARAIDFFNSTTRWAAPFYVILSGGANHRSGAVVSIASWLGASEQRVAFLNDDSSASGWYMVQTNYPRWMPDPPSDPRRTVAEETLKDLQRPDTDQMAALTTWQTLSTFPVHNTDTFYSLVMQVDKLESLSRAYIRTAMVPKK